MTTSLCIVGAFCQVQLVGLVCLLPFFSPPLKLSFAGHNDPVGTRLLVLRATTHLQLLIRLNAPGGIMKECNSYNQSADYLLKANTHWGKRGGGALNA